MKSGKGLRLLRAAVFVSILFGMLLIFNNIVRQSETRLNRTLLPAFYSEPKNSIDLITIGSSACYQYVNTPYLYEKFGYTSYNLSTALQPPKIASYIMDEAEKTQNPQLYIVEVREFLHMSESSREQAIYCVTDSMDLSLNKWKLLVHGYETWEDRIEGFFDITKYHSYWGQVSEEALRFWRNRVKSETKSWNTRWTIKKQKLPQDPEELTELPLMDYNMEDLLYLLEACQAKKRNVLFILTPYVYKDFIPGRALTLKKVVEEYGYRFLDLTDEELVPLDYKKDFYNKNHVNVWGSEKVTLALGEYIEKEYNIQTQHAAAVQEDWDAFAVRNRAEMEAAGPYGSNRTLAGGEEEAPTNSRGE